MLHPEVYMFCQKTGVALYFDEDALSYQLSSKAEWILLRHPRGKTLFRLFYKNKEDLPDIVISGGVQERQLCIIIPPPKRRRDERD